jgi:hypothetical protein
MGQGLQRQATNIPSPEAQRLRSLEPVSGWGRDGGAAGMAELSGRPRKAASDGFPGLQAADSRRPQATEA